MRLSLLALLFVAVSAPAETKITEKMKDDDKDTSILIQKKINPNIERDYEVVTGEEDIEGDESAGKQKALESYNKRCAEWKKEIREDNKTNKILVLSCGGKKTMTTDGTGSGAYTYTSKGTYKIQVRIRDPQK